MQSIPQVLDVYAIGLEISKLASLCASQSHKTWNIHVVHVLWKSGMGDAQHKGDNSEMYMYRIRCNVRDGLIFAYFAS